MYWDSIPYSSWVFLSSPHLLSVVVCGFWSEWMWPNWGVVPRPRMMLKKEMREELQLPFLCGCGEQCSWRRWGFHWLGFLEFLWLPLSKACALQLDGLWWPWMVRIARYMWQVSITMFVIPNFVFSITPRMAVGRHTAIWVFSFILSL